MHSQLPIPLLAFALLLAPLISAALIPAHPLLARDLSANSLVLPTLHRQPTSCPNFATSPINPSSYLGAEPNGCSWKGAFICANLLVGCPAVCISAALEIGINPFTDVPCLSCLGYSVGTCAECFVAIGGFPALCAASQKLPRSYGGCLFGTCRTKGSGVGLVTGTSVGTGAGATA